MFKNKSLINGSYVTITTTTMTLTAVTIIIINIILTLFFKKQLYPFFLSSKRTKYLWKAGYYAKYFKYYLI